MATIGVAATFDVEEGGFQTQLGAEGVTTEACTTVAGGT
jgi:hypothetical protein